MQRRFVQEYKIDLNATQAAIRAGYCKNTAYSMGHQLLKKLEIAEAIEHELELCCERTRVTKDKIIRELARIGFANIGTILDDASGGLLDGLSEDDLAAVSTVKTKTLRTDKDSDDIILEREIKFHDKGKALEQLGRHLGMFNDKLDVTISKTQEEAEAEMKEMVDRAKANRSRDSK
ncbi:MAG: terminase small subunit [Dehalococcoidia bacterium]|jgi:phage terminase small subunit